MKNDYIYVDIYESEEIIMKYLGENIKKLGFGLMRLSKKDEVIDVEQVKEMVDRFKN